MKNHSYCEISTNSKVVVERDGNISMEEVEMARNVVAIEQDGENSVAIGEVSSKRPVVIVVVFEETGREELIMQFYNFLCFLLDEGAFLLIKLIYNNIINYFYNVDD